MIPAKVKKHAVWAEVASRASPKRVECLVGSHPCLTSHRLPQTDANLVWENSVAKQAADAKRQANRLANHATIADQHPSGASSRVRHAAAINPSLLAVVAGTEKPKALATQNVQ